MPAQFLNADDAFKWIESFYNNEKIGVCDDRSYRLERMETLCRIFKDPQKSFRSVHIAGSKGKSTTARYIASVLSECGAKTGLYTSPHLKDYRERITLGGRFFPDETYIKAVKAVKAKKAAVLRTETFAEFPPTVFELLTLCAFLIFRDEKCDYAVIETGLGGRLDATNVITPRLSVLTPIEKEHTAILGDSPAKIAAEKGGIIKANVPVQSSDQDEEVKAVLNQIAFGKNSEISYLSDSVKKIETELSLSGTKVTVEPEFGPTETFTLTNIGEVFAKDAVTAALAVRQLSHIDFIENALPKRILAALSKTAVPGHFQIIGEKPLVVADPAHTKNSAKYTAETFKKIVKGKRILIFAAAPDKDVEAMADAVGKLFSSVIVTKFEGFRSGGGERDYRIFSAVNKKTVFEPDPDKALQSAKEILGKKKRNLEDGGILITGSFYLISRFLQEASEWNQDSLPG